MARLRLAGLKGALGASLTSGATSITFAAALTYNNGTAVPTLGANDYIPITIKDASGNLSEIVWLTAYTTAGTTGTIARGKEGTTGSSHASGDKWVHSPTPADLFTVSRPDDPNDPLWGADLGYDLEFEVDDTSGTLPSGWSWVNQGTSTWQKKFGAGVLTPQNAGSGDGFRMIVRNLPSGTTWDAYAKMPMNGPNENWNRWGLILRESSSGKFTYFGKTSGGGWLYGDVTVNDWNSPTSFNGSELHSPGGVPDYLRIRKNASTYDFLFSIDGIVWSPFLLAKTPFATYDQIGFGANASQDYGRSVHWFRVR